MTRTLLAAGLLAALLLGCARTVLVPVPPRVELQPYGTIGIVEFTSNAIGPFGAQATRRFQEQVQAAQPGTRFIDLGTREALLAQIGARSLDAEAVRRIGQRHGVAALFTGELAYSDPRTGVQVRDLAKLDGGVRTEIRGDLSSRLLETASGASVWSSSSWARRPVGGVEFSADRGVSGGVRGGDAREDMLPALVHHLTHDFRPSTVRQPAP